MDHDSAIAPVLGTRPKVGRSPVTPVRADGDEIEPRVSLPTLKPTNPPAVAAAGPAEEPLEPSSGLHGFLVIPSNHTSPQASSPSESFAIRIAPAASSRVTTVASESMI